MGVFVIDYFLALFFLFGRGMNLFPVTIFEQPACLATVLHCHWNIRQQAKLSWSNTCSLRGRRGKERERGINYPLFAPLSAPAFVLLILLCATLAESRISLHLSCPRCLDLSVFTCANLVPFSLAPSEY